MVCSWKSAGLTIFEIIKNCKMKVADESQKCNTLDDDGRSRVDAHAPGGLPGRHDVVQRGSK
jgi:hypothetical protein